MFLLKTANIMGHLRNYGFLLAGKIDEKTTFAEGDICNILPIPGTTKLHRLQENAQFHSHALTLPHH